MSRTTIRLALFSVGGHRLAGTSPFPAARLGKGVCVVTKIVLVFFPATVAASATAAARPSATITASATAASFFPGLGFVNGERPSAYFFAVQRTNGGLSLLIAAHLDKAETLGAAGFPIANDLSRFDRTELLKQPLQITVGRVIGQVADVQLLRHAGTPPKRIRNTGKAHCGRMLSHENNL